MTHSWVGSRANCSVPLVDSKDNKAGHLIELVRIQTVTRREARTATQGESPLVSETAAGLLDQILKSQGTDPLPDWSPKLEGPREPRQ